MLFYYPNRPSLIPPDPNDPLNPKPDYLNDLEAKKMYLAEQKWNGDNVLIYTDTMRFMNRRGQRHRYVPTPEVEKELKAFPKNAIINAELVHYKIADTKYKNILICHTILAWKGKPLIGKTWGDARNILQEQKFGKHVRLSKVWKKGFWDLFQQADGKVIEGIILKDPNGKIIISTAKIPDVSYMYKIRKPHKNYSF